MVKFYLDFTFSYVAEISDTINSLIKDLGTGGSTLGRPSDFGAKYPHFEPALGSPSSISTEFTFPVQQW